MKIMIKTEMKYILPKKLRDIGVKIVQKDLNI